MLLKLNKMEQNRIIFTSLWFDKKYLTDPLRDSHIEFTGKNKVDNTTGAKLCGLIGSNQQNSFQ